MVERRGAWWGMPFNGWTAETVGGLFVVGGGEVAVVGNYDIDFDVVGGGVEVVVDLRVTI